MRNVTVGQMGSAGQTITVADDASYKMALCAAGISMSGVKALMDDVNGYVSNFDAEMPAAVTMLVVSAPKFKAGFGDIPEGSPETITVGGQVYAAVTTPVAEATRTITVGQMGQPAVTVTITASTTYRQAATDAGFSTFKAIMNDVGGYVDNVDAPIDASVSMLVLSAPKFKAGFGDIPEGSPETITVGGQVYAAVAPAPEATRTITVGQMGQPAVTVTITASTTYRQAATDAGFSTFKAIMNDVGGYVDNVDAPIDASVSMLVLSAPKFKAGFGDIPEGTPETITVGGQVYAAVAPAPEATRTITVGQMGQPAVTVTITASTTYRQAAADAGFSTFKAIMNDVGGYVDNVDAPVDASVSMLVLSAPKFKAGVFPFDAAPAPAPATRPVSVGKMGQPAVTVQVTADTTFGQAVAMAGFGTPASIMDDVSGYVQASTKIPAATSMIIVSAPKFKAGQEE